jgi:hypothetical protein
VLWLDGHVEFVKYGEKYPVASGPEGTWGMWLHHYLADMCGQG